VCALDKGMKNHPPSRSRRNPSQKPIPPKGAYRGKESSPTPRLTLHLYGHHAVRQAILNPNRTITAIFATSDQADMVDEWVRTARQSGLKRPGIHMPDRAAFDAALPRDAVHQGVGITCDPLPDTDLDDILRGQDQNKATILVMLDQVTDPHNFGAILRSACAFGAIGVIVQRRHTPEINGLIAKTACGAADHIPVAYESNLARSIEQCKDAGFTVIGLDERGAPLNARPSAQAEGPVPTERAPRVKPEGPSHILLVLGAEGPGLRRLVREGCDRLVSLPTHAPIASLNVSNAAAVALYHFATNGLD
jgi:23S rRNA (guanosine2251-2'-O)-methyltransferase